MRLPLAVVSCVLLSFFPAALKAGEEVWNKELLFHFTVPDGFRPVPAKVQRTILYAFQRPSKDADEPGTLILISRLGGVLDRKRIDPQEVAAKNPQVTVGTEKWKSFEIDVVRVPEQLLGTPWVTYNAQVPLKPEAIQVSVSGRGSEETELKSLLQEVLRDLDGHSNWLTTQERFLRLKHGVRQFMSFVSPFVVVLVILFLVWRNNRKSRLGPGKCPPGPPTPRTTEGPAAGSAPDPLPPGATP
jgi:hypothetical protein